MCRSFITGFLGPNGAGKTTTLRMHIQDPEQRAWIQAKVEVPYARPSRDEQMRVLRRLNAAEAFETFLQTKFVGQKRFSLEGGESVIALMDRIMTQEWRIEGPRVLDIGDEHERVGKLEVGIVGGRVDVVTHDDSPTARVEITHVEGLPVKVTWDGITLRVLHGKEWDNNNIMRDKASAVAR